MPLASPVRLTSSAPIVPPSTSCSPNTPSNPEPTPITQEAYTAAMEAVIQKHFFPDLAKMKAQVALMDAMEGGTPDQVQEANDLMERAELLEAGTIEVPGLVCSCWL